MWWIWLACTAPDTGVETAEPVEDSGSDSDTPIRTGGTVVATKSPTCLDPIQGFERISEEAAARGLVWQEQEDPLFSEHYVSGGGVTVSDLDGDSDLDVLLGNVRGMPWVFENDGSAHFTAHPPPVELFTTYREHITNTVVLDDTGDGLPELFLLSPGRIWRSENLGSLGFGEPELVFDLGTGPVPVIYTVALGDADGDGDIDFFVPSADIISAPGEQALQVDPALPAGPHHWLYREGDAYVRGPSLQIGDPGQLSLLALFTDRDRDGDLDLLVSSDRGESSQREPSTFLRNDDGVFVDDGKEVGARLRMSGMGAAVFDHNGDGRLDYLLADFRGFRFMQSAGDRWVEAQALVGLTPPQTGPELAWWFGWSSEASDLDNDGWVDLATAGGLPFRPKNTEDLPLPQLDGLWQGQSDGTFVDKSKGGFGDPRDHIGLVTADLDGDGWLDIVVSGTEGPARLWMNHCGLAHHVEVRLKGPPLNTAGLGAMVELTSGERTWLSEIQGPRSLMQGPPRVHIGLGERDEPVRLRVRWPDGVVTEAAALPIDSVLQVTHPDVGESTE